MPRNTALLTRHGQEIVIILAGIKMSRGIGIMQEEYNETSNYRSIVGFGELYHIQASFYSAKRSGRPDADWRDNSEGYLSGECNVGEEEFEQIAEFLEGCENIVIDSSFLAHADAKNIFEFLQMLGKNVVFG